MKKVIVFLILTIGYYIASGNENKSYNSIEIDAIYGYHFLDDWEHRNFYNNYNNYGFSIFFPRHINKLKVSPGVNYYHRSYYYIPDYIPDYVITPVQRRIYKIQYLNLPMLVSFELLSLKSVKLNILFGTSINFISHYEIETIYTNKDPVIQNDFRIRGRYILGLSILQGITIVKPLNQRMNLIISPHSTYKLRPESEVFENQRDDVYKYRYPIYDRWSVGIKIGIEYVF